MKKKKGIKKTGAPDRKKEQLNNNFVQKVKKKGSTKFSQSIILSKKYFLIL